jgi:hypothetical protein
VGLVLLVSFCVSCGYGFVRYGGKLGDVRKVVIETPRNDSTDPGLEFVVADALRREFLRRRGARVIEDAAQADLVLSGSVRSLGERGEAFSSVVLAIEYQLSMELELSARRPDGSEVPIDPRAQRETETYLSSPDLEAQRKNREEAVRHLAATLASRVYDSLYESLTP